MIWCPGKVPNPELYERANYITLLQSWRRTARELGSRRFAVAEALEQAALAELHARKPDRVLATNVEFWSAVVLDTAEIPPELFTSMFTCARVAGWSAHILEQKREGRLIRPTAKYVGPGPRPLADVAGS